MSKPMTRFGIGPVWGFPSILYLVLTVVITYAFPAFRMPDSLYPMLTYLAVLLLLVGIPYYVVSAKAVMKAFSAGELVTNGVYGVCRHPLYGSWIVFIVPAIALLFHSWLSLTAPLVMYVLLRAMVAKEEDYLAEEFGEAYLEYKKKVPFVCPTGWLKR